MADTPSVVLVIDDDDATRLTVEALLASDGYELRFADSGREGLRLAAELRPDAILLDLMMPGMDGFEVCRRLRLEPRLTEVPVIVVSALDDRDSRLQAIEAGADEILAKPFDRTELRARLRTVTRLNRYRLLNAERDRFETLFHLSPDGVLVLDERGTVLLANESSQRLVGSSGWLSGRPVSSLLQLEKGKLSSALRGARGVLLRADGTGVRVEASASTLRWAGREATQVVVRDVSEQVAAEVRIRTLNATLVEAQDATIEGWSRALELRDRETEGHTRRVTELTVRLAAAFGFAGEDLDHVRRGALLHDIGKMGVADSILLKPGPLDEAEWAAMRQHPVLARDLLAPIRFLRPAIDIPLRHHEKWDGSGYPDGLKREEIPLAARIFAAVDVWDALTSDRPYRAAWSKARARAHIAAGSGSHFDPGVVSVFLAMLAEGEVASASPEAVSDLA